MKSDLDQEVAVAKQHRSARSAIYQSAIKALCALYLENEALVVGSKPARERALKALQAVLEMSDGS